MIAGFCLGYWWYHSKLGYRKKCSFFFLNMLRLRSHGVCRLRHRLHRKMAVVLECIISSCRSKRSEYHQHGNNGVDMEYVERENRTALAAF